MSEGSEGTFFTEEERKVFTQYGITLLLVQRFEWSLKRLSNLYTDLGKEPTLEEVLEAVQKKFASAAGPLTKHLKKHKSVPEKFLEEVEQATNARNYLAHEYLFQYVLKKRWGVKVNPQAAITYLQSQAQYFQELDDELDKLIREREQELGIDRILTSDTGRLLEEVIQEKMLESESEEEHS